MECAGVYERVSESQRAQRQEERESERKYMLAERNTAELLTDAADQASDEQSGAGHAQEAARDAGVPGEGPPGRRTAAVGYEALPFSCNPSNAAAGQNSTAQQYAKQEENLQKGGASYCFRFTGSLSVESSYSRSSSSSGR